jgi:hypothetical protein
MGIWLWCVWNEERWGYTFIGLGVCAFIAVALISALLFALRSAASGKPIMVDPLKMVGISAPFSLTGPPVVIILLVLSAGAAYGAYSLYTNKKTAYFEAAGSNSEAPLLLGEVLSKLGQGNTHLTVSISKKASNFLVPGALSGECRADLFQRICRQYEDLSCSDVIDGKMSISLKSEKY